MHREAGRLWVWYEIWGLKEAHYLPHYYKEKEEEKKIVALLKPHGSTVSHLFLCTKELWLQYNRIMGLLFMEETWESILWPLLPCHWETRCRSDLPKSHSVMEVTSRLSPMVGALSWVGQRVPKKTVGIEERSPKTTKHGSILWRETKGKFKFSAVQSWNKSTG